MVNRIRYKNICVNLKRRPDRKIAMIHMFGSNGIHDYEFFEAVDGKEIKSDHPDLLIFENINSRKIGVIGCAMSHINIWKKLVIDKNYDYYMIFEDDAKLVNNYSLRFDKVISQITPSMDLIFLGCFKPKIDKYTNGNTNTIHKFEKKDYSGGFFGYLINKNGANKLLTDFNKNGIKQAIDYAIYDSDINIYEVLPHLVTSTMVQHFNDNVDSDIQKDYTYVPKYNGNKHDENGSESTNYFNLIIIILFIMTIIALIFLIYALYRYTNQ